METRKKAWSWVAAATLSLLVAGCGGGGGGESNSSAAVNDYSQQQFSVSQLNKFLDVVFSIRPNVGGAQITSDRRAAQELGLATLTLQLDVVVPPNASTASPQPLLVFVHGGGLVAGNKDDLMPTIEGYARAGYVVASVNYRMSPALASEPGLKTQALTEASEDVMSAVRHLRFYAATYGIDSTRIAMIGYSSGGELALINALDADTLQGATPDFPGTSSKVDGVITTGATLFNGSWSPDALLSYDATDTPVLLMHANPQDGLTLETWTDAVLPTASRINGSGNTCSLVQQPDQSHMADLTFGGPYFSDIDSFLRTRLRLN